MDYGLDLGAIRDRFAAWTVVAEPDRDEPEWWVGAPSVCRDDAGAFWMATRMRTADAPLGLRGYEIRIHRSDDGIAFETVLSLRREEVGVPGFERPALFRDPVSGRIRLMGCSPIDGTWSIIEWPDAERPDRFRPSGARIIIEPLPRSPLGAETPTGYKDPVVCVANGVVHCYVIGIQGRERVFHFHETAQGWEPVGDPCASLMPLAGWHTHAVRPACVVPMGTGMLFVYEGSSSSWPDPSYNIATGLGWTFDLHHVIDLTPDEPLLISPTPGRLHAWRYSHWMWVGSELWAYAEVEKSNGAHEVRLFRLPVS